MYSLVTIVNNAVLHIWKLLGNGNPLQYSCLESPMDRGAWWTTVQRKGHKELDTIKRQTTHYTLPYIAENQNTTFYKHFDELERSS